MGGRAVERRSERYTPQREVNLGRYTRRMPGVRLEVGLPIKVRNAHEMVLWWDAQVPDRLPSLGSKAA